MPIDSQVVNGRFVSVDHDESASLEIDQGRIVRPDGGEAWRTVDASGYYVLPGAIQLGDPGPGAALDLIRQGIASAIVSLNCGPADLDAEIARVKSNAVLDYAICWTLSPETGAGDIEAARELGVAIFDAGSSHPDESHHTALAGATVRISADSPDFDAWLAAAADARIILTNASAANLERAIDAKASSASDCFLETDLDTLLRNEDPLWNAIAAGQIDIVARGDSDDALLQSLYAEGVIRRGLLSMSHLVDLIAGNPASACGLAPYKGRLRPGSDADFVVFDPDQVGEVRGMHIPGRVVYAQLRGEILLFNDELHLAPGDGLRIGAGVGTDDAFRT